jgi:diazepam-binding inhibitor (GABA receptor modulating acyl-CoA-binding protein)
MFDLKGKYKWDAWTKNNGMSKDDAQKKYVALVKELQAKQ